MREWMTGEDILYFLERDKERLALMNKMATESYFRGVLSV
jgi:hypothetical protein